MAITGIPDYDGRQPLAVFINCPRCMARFLVWTAPEDPATVEPLGDYRFMDSRKQSIIDCSCGEIIPLVEYLAVEGVM